LDEDEDVVFSAYASGSRHVDSIFGEFIYSMLVRCW